MNAILAVRRSCRRAGLATLAAAALVLAIAPARAADLPERPEALKFPPLAYTPPGAATWRTTIAGGIPAYLVPDRTVPLAWMLSAPSLPAEMQISQG